MTIYSAYFFTTHTVVDQNKVCSKTNKRPADFRNVKVYAGNQYHEPANAIVTNLEYNSYPYHTGLYLISFTFSEIVEESHI